MLKNLEVAEEAGIVRTCEIRGLSLIEATFQPGSHVPAHSHHKANFGILLKGTCTEIYGRKRRDYVAGSLDFLPVDHTHSVVYGHQPILTFGIHISPDLLDRVGEYSLVLDQSLHCHGGPLEWFFAKVYREFYQEDSAAHLAIEGLVFEMLAVTSRKQKGITSERNEPTWLKQAREMIHEHYLEPLTLIRIADAVGVHSVHLCREFRRHSASTIGEYVRQLRIKHACRQMLDPNASLAQIALASGFSDQSHFARTFKSLVGESPSTFRKTLIGP